MKVEMIESPFGRSFISKINAFIEGKKVIDIKFQSVAVMDRGQSRVVDRALILYEGEEDERIH